MSKSNSTAPAKPAKPYPDFPSFLTPPASEPRR